MNRKNKGFTLIELLAVIIILAVILVIASTSVLKSKRTAEEKLRYIAAKEIVEMAEAYMAANNISEGESISIREMCKSGYISDEATNPSTGKNIKSCDELEGQTIALIALDEYGGAAEENNYTLKTDGGSIGYYQIGSYVYNGIKPMKGYVKNEPSVNDGKDDDPAVTTTTTTPTTTTTTTTTTTSRQTVQPSGSGTVDVTGIALNKNTINMLYNDSTSKKVTATISPSNATNKSVTWTSSNTRVATVNNSGSITAKGIGEAKITAKTSNGKTASVTVTVKQNVIVVVGASQVTRMASYASSYKKGNNKYSVDEKTLVYSNLGGTGIPWQYEEGTDKNGKPKGLTRTQVILGRYNKTYTKFYVIYPLAGNTIQYFTCKNIVDDSVTINGRGTVKGYVAGYNNAVSKLKNSGYTVTAYVTAMHPVRADDPLKEGSKVVYNNNENACAKGYRSNYKYYVFNETMKYLIKTTKPDYKYISVFEDIMNLKGATVNVNKPSTINPTAFSYRRIVDDNGEFRYTTVDGIHWNARTTRTYLRMILDKVSEL